MKAILEFNLPDDAYEFAEANKATSYHSAITEIVRNVRARVKYQETWQEASEEVSNVYDAIFDILNEYNIDPWE